MHYFVIATGNTNHDFDLGLVYHWPLVRDVMVQNSGLKGTVASSMLSYTRRIISVLAHENQILGVNPTDLLPVLTLPVFVNAPV